MPEYGADQGHARQVRIHIDQNPVFSPSPTTGEALYLLGQVPGSLVLYREVSGDEEDQSIVKGPELAHLEEDEHFHSGPEHRKEITIYVNGTEKQVQGKDISFDQLVSLAFTPVPSGPNILFTISYDEGPHENREGSMKEGQIVHIKKGMIFNVTTTDKS